MICSRPDDRVRRSEHPDSAESGLEWSTGQLWLAEQEVNMLRHDYLSVNVESVTVAHSLRF